MNELLKLLKTARSPGGDLYLTKTHADQLIRWVEISNKMIDAGDAAIRELKQILELIELAKGEPSETARFSVLFNELQRFESFRK